MYADDAINVINKYRTKEIVLTTMTPGRYWKEISEKPEIDFPVYGVMGKASSVGLGLSLAKPDQKILVLDGDGGLLMNLGSLVTISSADPKNFIHIVFDDGVYYTTGSQPIPGKDKYDFKNIAVGSGIEKSYSFDDLETFSAELEFLLNEDGPIFISLKIEHKKTLIDAWVGNSKENSRKIKKYLENKK